jgi:hypothetical protein
MLYTSMQLEEKAGAKGVFILFLFAAALYFYLCVELLVYNKKLLVQQIKHRIVTSQFIYS